MEGGLAPKANKRAVAAAKHRAENVLKARRWHSKKKTTVKEHRAMRLQGKNKLAREVTRKRMNDAKKRARKVIKHATHVFGTKKDVAAGRALRTIAGHRLRNIRVKKDKEGVKHYRTKIRPHPRRVHAEYKKSIGSRAEVLHGTAHHTAGGLVKTDLRLKHGRVRSVKKIHAGLSVKAVKWNMALLRARRELKILKNAAGKLILPRKDGPEGSAARRLYDRAHEIFKGHHAARKIQRAVRARKALRAVHARAVHARAAHAHAKHESPKRASPKRASPKRVIPKRASPKRAKTPSPKAARPKRAIHAPRRLVAE